MKFPCFGTYLDLMTNRQRDRPTKKSLKRNKLGLYSVCLVMLSKTCVLIVQTYLVSKLIIKILTRFDT